MDFKGRTLELKKGIWTNFPSLCKGCGLCIQKCPKKCIAWCNVLGFMGTPTVEANDECIACGICEMVCPDCAIHVEKKIADGTTATV